MIDKIGWDLGRTCGPNVCYCLVFTMIDWIAWDLAGMCEPNISLSAAALDSVAFFFFFFLNQ